MFLIPKIQTGDLKCVVFLGQRINQLHKGNQSRGDNKVIWNGKNLSGNKVSSGTYFIHIQNENKFLMVEQSDITKIRQLSKKMRKNILTMSLAAGASSSHFGGSLSTVELLATLYNNVLKFDVTDPLWDDRDRFILSKGHACLGYYSVLCEKGFFAKEDLQAAIFLALPLALDIHAINCLLLLAIKTSKQA